MNIQQLRYIHEVVRAGLKISDAADTLFTSQPGVSKQIKLLEEELGISIFERHGKRIVGITEPGREVLAIAERMLREANNLLQVGAQFSQEESGRLVIATTHTQARYALPEVISAFMRRYPKVRLSLHQGSPRQLCEMVLSSEADFVIATEAIADYSELVMLPCYEWNRSVIAPTGHPILREQSLTLEAISQYPIITYDFAFAGRGLVNKAFLARGLQPNVVLTAIDSDVIKTYVAMGLGIGIIASMAYNPTSDRQLKAINASHLFESSTTRIGIPKNAYLRGYMYAFIEMFAPHLTQTHVMKSLISAQ